MSLFDTFHKDYIDFSNYIKDILDGRYTSIAAENELVSNEKEFLEYKFSRTRRKINSLSN